MQSFDAAAVELPATDTAPPEQVATAAAKPVEVMPAAPSEKKSLFKSFVDMPAVETKPEAAPVEDTEWKNAKAADWKQVKADRDAAKQRADQLSTELERAKKATPDPTIYTKQIAELEAELEKSSIERSPRFKSEFIAPREQAVADARALAAELAVEPELVDKAMKLTGKDRRAFIDENFDSPSAVAEFATQLRKIDEIDARKTAALASAHENAAKYAQEQERGVSAEIIRQFDSILPEAQKNLSVLRPIAGNDAYNAELQADLDYSRQILNGTAAPEDIIAAPLLAVTGKRLLPVVAAQAQEISELKARVAELTKARPGVHGRGGDAPVKLGANGRVPTFLESFQQGA